MLSKMNHRRFIKLVGVVRDFKEPEEEEEEEEKEEEFGIISEWIDGDTLD